MKVLLTFTYDVSLEIWEKKGLIYREVSLYRELSKNNVNFSFLTYGTDNDLKYSDLLGDIKIYPAFSYIKSKSSLMQFIKSRFLSLKLKNVIKEFDIIKTNQTKGSWIAIIAKIFYKKKIIVRAGYDKLNAWKSFAKRKGLRNYINYLFYYSMIFLNELIAYKLADGIILTNDYDIQFVKKYFKLKKKYKRNKIRLIYNFIDENLFRPINVPIKDKHVIFIGRLSHEKNLYNLLKAIKDLKGFKLDIVGMGPEESELKRKIKELNVDAKHLGVFPNDKIPEILNQYQIFILPSMSEGNPKVLLEAMSCGIACIGTDVKGINNIIHHKKNGYLCDISSDSIKDAILTLYNDEYLRTELGKNARQFVLKNCSLNSIVEKEYLFYREILNLGKKH